MLVIVEFVKLMLELQFIVLLKVFEVPVNIFEDANIKPLYVESAYVFVINWDGNVGVINEVGKIVNAFVP